MAFKKKSPPKKISTGTQLPLQDEAQAALTSLERKSTSRDRENLTRFGITAGKAFGVSMANLLQLAKRLGRNHQLAAALWDTAGTRPAC
jgi:3-methyladenine DNA glycosylase AlkD